MAHFRTCPRTGSCWCEIRQYASVLAVGLAILAGELAGGYLSGSLALMADAFHVFMDSGAIVVSIALAYRVRIGKPEEEHHIRRKGTGIQAAFLAVIVIWIVSEAFGRLRHPPEIESSILIAIAILGAIGNYIQHRMLRRTDASDDANITRRALDRHVLSDLAQSIAVVVGGILIAITDWYWLDPLLSLVVAFLMMYWVIQIVRDGGAKPAHHH